VSTRAEQYAARVLAIEPIGTHLRRLVLGGPGLTEFSSTGIPDEWVGLIVPGQFQSRYYTVRAWDGATLTLDVVLHEAGLVTEWVQTASVNDVVTITEPKGSYSVPSSAGWVLAVGDLTALPALARIAETPTPLPVRLWAETPEELPGYFPATTDLTWLTAPPDSGSALAEVVEALDWPEGDGYFWMAGESAQMRAIRKHLMRERRLAATAYDVMGYWRGTTHRTTGAVTKENHE
jgi:NADPH-dependent ferric siderophore reductase